MTPVGEKQSRLDIDVNMQMGGLMRLMEFFIASGFKREFDEITGEIKRMVEA